MDDQNWLSKCIFIFCTIVTIKNAASIPHAPMSQEDRLMSVLSSKRRHSPSAPAVDDRYQGFYTPGFPRYTDPHNNGRHRSTRPIGFQPPPGRQPSQLPKHPGRMPKPNRMHKSRPTWPTNILPKRNVTSTQHDDFETHIEQTTQPMIPHAGGGGYTDQSVVYPQQGLGGQYNPMGNTGQSNTGVILQSILNPANCVPGGVCPQGGLLGGLGNVLGGGMGSNGFGGGFGGGMGNNGFGGGFGNNGFGGGMGNNGYGGGMDSNGYGGGLGNNGYGGGLGSLGNLFPQGNNGDQSTATSTTTDPFLSLNLDSSNNSTDYSSLDSFGDYGFNMTSSDYGLSLDDSSNSTSTTEGNSTSTTESNSTSSVTVSEKGSATNSTEVIGKSSNSSTTSISSSDSKENGTSTDNFGLDSFDFNYGSFDSTSNYGDSDLKLDDGNKDLIFSYDNKDLNNDDYLASDYDD